MLLDSQLTPAGLPEKMLPGIFPPNNRNK